LAGLLILFVVIFFVFIRFAIVVVLFLILDFDSGVFLVFDLDARALPAGRRRRRGLRILDIIQRIFKFFFERLRGRWRNWRGPAGSN